MRFRDRIEAGRRLAERLRHLRGQDVVVLGLPRGGVPVAFEVAKELGAPLDVIVVRKLGVPYQPELGMGAIGEDGVRILNQEIVRLAHVSGDELAAVEARERVELERRLQRFRGTRPRVSVDGRTAVIVDDGIATGSTARAACRVARAHGAARVILAVPVAGPEAQTAFAGDADEVICVEMPTFLQSIGQWYDDFTQVRDEEVSELLDRAAAAPAPVAPAPAASDPSAPDPAASDPAPRAVATRDVVIPAGPVHLEGRLTVPDSARGVVLFAHGSGSSRHSPRNRYVADLLVDAGLATLLFDLLSRQEEGNRANVFDIDLLTMRLLDATAWVRAQAETRELAVGYFGASTGAAAALAAAAVPGSQIAAVVSRGGRPDLAHGRLERVTAPTLLIVGEYDDVVLGLNRQAHAELRAPSRLAVVPGATHLFEEPGTLQSAALLARDWFIEHLGGPGAAA